MAYEAKTGHLGPQWRDNLQAEMHYMMQWANYLLGAQVTEKGKDNPVPQPKFPRRPWLDMAEVDAEGEEDDGG